MRTQLTSQFSCEVCSPDLHSPELWNMTFRLKPAQQFVPHWCLILCHLFYYACYATPASFNMWLVDGRRATTPKRNANGCYREGNPSTVASGLLLYFKYSSQSSWKNKNPVNKGQFHSQHQYPGYEERMHINDILLHVTSYTHSKQFDTLN